MTLRRARIAVLAASCLAWAMTGRATAEPITYTIQGTGDITLAGVDHSAVDFTIDITADTADVTPDPVFGLLYLEAKSATIALAGIGTATLQDVPVLNLYNDPLNLLYVAGLVDGGLFFDGTADGFASYDLTSSAGPFPLTTFESFFDAPTDLGAFFLYGLTGPGTFRATLVGVPEPASLGLLGVGLAGLLACASRRRGLATNSVARG